MNFLCYLGFLVTIFKEYRPLTALGVRHEFCVTFMKGFKVCRNRGKSSSNRVADRVYEKSRRNIGERWHLGPLHYSMFLL